MIEAISPDRCVACDICVKVCPTNVFDKVQGAVPRIARQSDCQTCFMCEVYCPVDALYVSPLADQVQGVSLAFAEQMGVLGSYRRNIGWNDRQKVSGDLSFQLVPPKQASS